MFEWITSIEAWVALGTLTVLEIVLGIDNIIFISIVVGRLPDNQQNFARNMGILLAMVSRLALLFSIAWIVGADRPFFFNFRKEHFRTGYYSDRRGPISPGQGHP